MTYPGLKRTLSPPTQRGAVLGATLPRSLAGSSFQAAQGRDFYRERPRRRCQAAANCALGSVATLPFARGSELRVVGQFEISTGRASCTQTSPPTRSQSRACAVRRGGRAMNAPHSRRRNTHDRTGRREADGDRQIEWTRRTRSRAAKACAWPRRHLGTACLMRPLNASQTTPIGRGLPRATPGT